MLNIFFYTNLKIEYSVLIIYFFFGLLLTVLILAASYLFVLQKPETEKLSAYECGFEPYEDARHAVDIRFCLIAILFLIFDIEVMFIIPWTISVSKLGTLGFWIMIDFLVELIIGFIYVWYTNALDW